MIELDSVECFYKYAGVEGARYILRDGTLKFSLASEFDDPFDVAIQTLFGYDPIASLQQLRQEHVNILFAEGDLPAFNQSGAAQLTAWMRQNIVATPQRKEELKALLLADSAESIWNIERLRAVNEATLKQVQQYFSTDAIFCGSLQNNNQLLWAHYSQDHQGVALEFAANKEKDSLLRVMTRVRYSNERPLLYRSPRDFMEKSMFRDGTEAIQEYIHSLIFTKNMEWAYQQEVRAIMPLCMRPGEKYKFHRYHSDELRSMYIGCKMNETVEQEFIALARSKNPDVKIFKMKMDTASYALIPFAVD